LLRGNLRFVAKKNTEHYRQLERHFADAAR
jgi:hypothetical protein